jgi:hypothetical protein
MRSRNTPSLSPSLCHLSPGQRRPPPQPQAAWLVVEPLCVLEEEVRHQEDEQEGGEGGVQQGGAAKAGLEAEDRGEEVLQADRHQEV